MHIADVDICVLHLTYMTNFHPASSSDLNGIFLNVTSIKSGT